MSENLQILFLRYSQTKPIVSFVAYCLFNPFTVCIFGTNCPISVGFHQLKRKQYPNRRCKKQNQKQKQKQKQKTNNDFRLILLDHITFWDYWGEYRGGGQENICLPCPPMPYIRIFVSSLVCPARTLPEKYKLNFNKNEIMSKKDISAIHCSLYVWLRFNAHHFQNFLQSLAYFHTSCGPWCSTASLGDCAV